MDQRLAESWINRDDHVVLGRKLNDYCLYHALFLTLAENPVVLGRPATMAQLQEAVLVCSSDPQIFLRARQPMTARQRMIWRWQIRKCIPVLEAKRFGAYLQDFDQRPKFWEDADSSGGEGSLRAPWILSMTCFLENNTNMTEHEIMSAPIGKMFWKSAAIAELLGISRAQIVSEEEEEAMKEMGIDL